MSISSCYVMQKKKWNLQDSSVVNDPTFRTILVTDKIYKNHYNRLVSKIHLAMKGKSILKVHVAFSYPRSKVSEERSDRNRKQQCIPVGCVPPASVAAIRCLSGVGGRGVYCTPLGPYPPEGAWDQTGSDNIPLKDHGTRQEVTT